MKKLNLEIKKIMNPPLHNVHRRDFVGNVTNSVTPDFIEYKVDK